MSYEEVFSLPEICPDVSVAFNVVTDQKEAVSSTVAYCSIVGCLANQRTRMMRCPISRVHDLKAATLSNAKVEVDIQCKRKDLAAQELKVEEVASAEFH